MGLDRPIDFTAEQRKAVLALLVRHLPNTTAWVYGSRVKWTSSLKSDLDVVVFATPQQARQVSNLREAFEESNLPFRVDLFVWDEVPEQFHKQIEAEHVVLVERRGEPFEGRSSFVLGDWVHYRLESCMAAIIDYRGKTPRKTPSGVPLITAKVVKDGRIKTPTEFIAIEDYDSWMRRGLPRVGDVLVTTEAPLGEVAQLDRQRVVLAQRLILLRGKPGILNNRFLKFLMQSAPVQDQLRARASGTTVFGIKQRELRQIGILVPPIQEQRSIAHVLGTLDDKIELNRQMNQTLEEMARALFKSWFVDFDPVHAKATIKHHAATFPQGGSDWSVERARAFLYRMDPDIAALFPHSFVDSELGLIPEGWEVKPMGELCNKPQYGYTASAKNEAVGPKFLRITDINKKAWIEWESVPYCEITGQDFDKYGLHEGDILIARMADPGHGCMIEERQQAVFASYLIRFRPAQKRYARLLQYWLRSDAYWELVRGRGGGTTRVSLNAKVLSEFCLVVPTCNLIDVFDEAGRHPPRPRGRKLRRVPHPHSPARRAAAEAGVGGVTHKGHRSSSEECLSWTVSNGRTWEYASNRAKSTSLRMILLGTIFSAGRKSVEVLTHLVGSLEGPCVLAVDAAWGSGKTTFLRIWAQYLRNQGFAVVEFNAWETDFAGDPFVSLSTELTEGLRAYTDETLATKIDNTRKVAADVIRRAVPGLIRVATAGILDVSPLIGKGTWSSPRVLPLRRDCPITRRRRSRSRNSGES